MFKYHDNNGTEQPLVGPPTDQPSIITYVLLSNRVVRYPSLVHNPVENGHL